MAVATTNAISGPYYTNGQTTSFPFSFKAMDEAEVGVLLRDGSGNETDVAPSLFTANLTDQGGTVVFEAAPSGGLALFIYSNPSFEQEIQFENGSRWLAGPVNEANDRAAVRDLVLAEALSRAIKLPRGETAPVLPPASERTNHRVLGFNSTTGAPEVQDASAFVGPPGLDGTGVFLSTAAGMAATEAGEYFEVPDDQLRTSRVLYRHDGSAVEVARAPAQALVDKLADPLDRIRSKINETSFGSISVHAGAVSVGRKDLVIASIFNSYGQGQNASFNDQPGEIARQEWQAAFPWLNVHHDNYSIPGAWIANYAGQQIDGRAPDNLGGKLGILQAHAQAMGPGGDGRRRIPDIVLIGPPTNDSWPNIFNSLQSPDNFDYISNALIERCMKDFDALVIGYNNPMLPCQRAMLTPGDIPRFDLGPTFLMTWPAAGFFAVDTYQILTYDVETQTIFCGIPGIFTPGLFDGNFFTTDGTCWLYVDEQHKLMRVVGLNADYTTITVDDGNGGPIITENRTTNKGFHMGNFDNFRQVIPIRNNDDLSRPSTAPANAPLAIEQRPFGANGELIHVSTRLCELNQRWERNLARNGALLCDWLAEQKKITTSDADIEAQFGNDTVHPAAPLYQLTRPPMKRIVDRAAYGLVSRAATNGDGDDVDTSGFDARITTAQATANAAQTALAGKAPLASPTFTGVPSAPTAAAGTTTDQLATTHFVSDAITNGNAATATKLATPHNINGVAFDGTAAITVPAVDTATPRIAQSEKGAANGVATLGTDAKIPSAQLPPIAITSTFVVNSQAAQLALVAQEGDVAVRTDVSRSYIHNAGTAGTMSDWNELLTPTDAVLSVNGQTGAVQITTISGNAGTATKLATARTINGVAFDGTANISVPADNSAWTAYVPTQSAQSGAITAGAAYIGGRYKQIGKTVFFTAHLITTVPATAAGNLNLGLPVAAANINAADASPNPHIVTALDDGPKRVLFAIIDPGSSSVRITQSDGTTPFNGNMRVVVSGHYETA